MAPKRPVQGGRAPIASRLGEWEHAGGFGVVLETHTGGEQAGMRRGCCRGSSLVS